MKSTSTTKFGHYLLSNILNDKFEDLISMFYIWAPNITIKGAMKKSNLNNILMLFLDVWLENGLNIP